VKLGVKESKKYAIGSIHENGGGKFEILERWFDESTDTIMLKYKFLEDGREETNKEANVNASEWKWRKVRGLAGKTETNQAEECSCMNMNLEQYFKRVYESFEKLNSQSMTGITQLKESFAEQHRMLLEMMSVIQIQQKQIDNLVNDRLLINKLLEKI